MALHEDLKVIKSQDFKETLTHTCTKEQALSILKDGYQIRDLWSLRKMYEKPRGMYLSVNKEWEEWCKSEEFAQEDNVQLFASLVPDKKILVIDSEQDFENVLDLYGREWWMNIPDDFMEFHKKYGRNDRYDLTYFQYNGQAFWTAISAWYDGYYLTSKANREMHLSHIAINTWDVATLVMFRPRDVTFGNMRVRKQQWFPCEPCKGTGKNEMPKFHLGEKQIDEFMRKSWNDLQKRAGGCYRCHGEGKIIKIVED